MHNHRIRFRYAEKKDPKKAQQKNLNSSSSSQQSSLRDTVINSWKRRPFDEPEIESINTGIGFV